VTRVDETAHEAAALKGVVRTAHPAPLRNRGLVCAVFVINGFFKIAQRY